MDEMDEIVTEFLVESHENLDQLDRDLVALERDPGARDLLASIFRTIHTIKGTSGFLAFGRLEQLTHVGENLLARLRDQKMTMTPATTDVLLAMVDAVRALLAEIEAHGGEGEVDVTDVVARVSRVLEEEQTPPMPEALAAPAAPTAPAAPAAPAVAPPDEPVAAMPPPVPAGTDTEPEPEHAHRRSVADASIRVDVDLLDSLMQLVGELVLTRNQVVRQAQGSEDVDLTRSAQRLNLIASELQEGVMKTRMQPIDHLWAKLPRVVRDLAAHCGKEVSLTMTGKETELDRSLLEAVKDPLTHLVRNSVDHGFENPADRVAAGKPRTGTLTLRAFHEGGQVVVEVSDDGGGIDPDRIASKALEKGLRTPAQLAAMAPHEVIQLIFAPGFSTAAAVTNVSGRGVGMDVVRTNIEAIGGAVEVESVLGRGTTCRLRIPLTLAIVPALTVECAGDRYAIGQANLLELVALDPARAATEIEDVSGARVHRLRGQLLPLVSLAELLQVDSVREDGHVVIAVLQAEGRRFGLLIDRVLSTEEIVVKPLTSQVKAIGLYSGATILGDGAVALILDVPALARRVLRADALESVESRAAADQMVESGGSGEDLRLLVTSLGGGRRAAVPLAEVTRLENLPQDAVEEVAGREVVQYRGEILPVVRLGRCLGVPDVWHGHADDVGEQHEQRDLAVVVWSSPAAGGRSAALVVEEIIDIVEDAAELRRDVTGFGVVGSADVRGRLVEVVDVAVLLGQSDPTFFDLAPARRQELS